MTDAAQQNARPSGLGGTVAVIVVSGVGDDALGQRTRCRGRRPSPRILTSGGSPGARRVRPPSSPLPTPATRVTTTCFAPASARPTCASRSRYPPAQVASAGAAPDGDVYEMHWADLSRAQGPVQRLFYLLFAITLQVSTIGLEAVRRFAENDTHNTVSPQRLRWLRDRLTALSYWLAYIITPLVLAQAALAVIVNLELLLPPNGGSVPSWVAVSA